MKKLLLIVMLLLSLACSKKQEGKLAGSIAEMPAVNDLPAMKITLMDGSIIDARQLKGKVILILFQPDCDHCQHEAEDIHRNLEAFKKYTLYFVSSASQPELEKFSVDYKLKGNDNIIFGMTTTDNIISSFGPIEAPSVYIYSDQKLVKDFNGQVDVGVIVKYL